MVQVPAGVHGPRSHARSHAHTMCETTRTSASSAKISIKTSNRFCGDLWESLINTCKRLLSIGSVVPLFPLRNRSIEWVSLKAVKLKTMAPICRSLLWRFPLFSERRVCWHYGFPIVCSWTYLIDWCMAVFLCHYFFLHRKLVEGIFFMMGPLRH